MPSNQKFYLMRHGEVFNPNHVIYGRLPGFFLSKNGRNEVQIAAQNLIGKEIKIIHTSPMERTQETARIVAETIGFPIDQIVIDQNLNECEFFNDWAGKPLDDFFASTYRDSFIEAKESVQKRISESYEKVLQSGENFLFVSHADLIMSMIDYLAKKHHTSYPYGYINTAQIVEISLT